MEKRKRDEPDYFGEALSNFTHDVASGGAIRHMVNLGYTVDEICRHLDFPTPRARVQETVFRYLTESGVLLGSLPIPEEAFEVRMFGQQAVQEQGDKKTLQVSVPCGLREKNEKWTQQDAGKNKNTERRKLFASGRQKKEEGQRQPGNEEDWKHQDACGDEMRRQQQDRRKFLEELHRQLERNGEAESYVSCPYGTIYRDREQRLGRMLSCLTGREREYILGIPWEMRVMYHRLTPRMLEIATQLALHGEVEQSFYFLRSRIKLW